MENNYSFIRRKHRVHDICFFGFIFANEFLLYDIQWLAKSPAAEMKIPSAEIL